MKVVKWAGKELVLDAGLENRFWSKVDKNGRKGCWQFTGSCHPEDGHGQIQVNTFLQGQIIKKSNMQKAHRVALVLTGIHVPEGALVRHMCNNPGCVNPQHLDIGDHKNNMDDMRRSGHQKGENNPACKIKEDQCVAIRWLRSQGFRLCDIAFLFDCQQSTVSRIANNKRRAVAMKKGSSFDIM